MESLIELISRFWAGYLLLALPFLYFLDEPFTIAVHQTLAVALLFLHMHGGGYQKGSRLSSWFFRFAFLWLIVQGLSAAFSVNPSVSVPGFVKILGLAAMAAGIRYLGEDGDVARSLFGAAVLAGILHGMLARAEYLEAAPIPASWVDPEMKGLIPTRCAGLFSDPNVFGAYLAGLLPFTLGGLFSSGGNTLLPYFYAAGYFGAAVGLLTTFSRTGYLAGLVAVVVFFLVRRPERRLTPEMKVFLAATALIAAVFLLGPFKYRFLSISNPSDMTMSQRTLINRGVMRGLERIPSFGFGLHTFSQVYPQFRIVGGDYPFNAHNEFLHTLVEAGPFSAGLLGLLSLLLAIQVWRQMRRPAAEVGPLTAAGSGAAAALFLQNLGGFSARIYPTAVLIAIAVGLVLRSTRKSRPDPDQPFQTLPWRFGGTVLLVLFLALTLKFLHIQLLMERAQAAQRANDHAEARQTLLAIEQVDPRIPLVNAMLAASEERAGDLDAARKRLEAAARLNPTEALFWAELSRLAQRTGQGNPLSLMEKAIALDPASEIFRLRCAQLLASAGRPLEAMFQLDEALRTSPGFDEVYTTYKAVKEYRRILLGQPAPESPGTASGSNPAPASATSPGRH